MILRPVLVMLLVHFVLFASSATPKAYRSEHSAVVERIVDVGSTFNENLSQTPQTPKGRISAEVGIDKVQKKSFPQRAKPSESKRPLSIKIKLQLDEFAIQLQNNTSATGYILMISPKPLSTEGENRLQGAANRLKDYLVNIRDVEPGRLTTATRFNSKEGTFQLWLVPAGAEAPRP